VWPAHSQSLTSVFFALQPLANIFIRLFTLHGLQRLLVKARDKTPQSSPSGNPCTITLNLSQ
jgi:hypothetical protein